MKAFQVINRVFLTTLCALSCFVVPSKADAIENCCEEQNECCDTGCGNWGRAALVIGSGLVAGAIAGAVSHSSSHHHHSSCCSAPSGATGPTGPTGATGADASNPFVTDEEALLTFSVSLSGLSILTLPSVPAGTLEVIPYVSTPDGMIIDGTAITSDNAIAGIINFPSEIAVVVVPVGDVVFGTYHFGLHFNTAGLTLSNTSTILQLSTLNPIASLAFASDPSANEIVALAPYALTTQISAGIDFQLETEYVYDPNNPSFVNP